MLSNTPPASVNVAAARVALAALWCAVVEPPHVFDMPRFRRADRADGADATAFAVELAVLPKPLLLAGGGVVGAHLIVELREVPLGAAPSTRMRPVCFLSDGLTSDPQDVLLLAGGQALRAPASAIARAGADYWLAAPATAAGGPPTDPWIQGLTLPAEWLSGVAAVWLLGAQTEDGGGRLAFDAGRAEPVQL